MQIAEFLTARTMGLCLVFQSMPSPLFLFLLLHLDSCLCWCSLEKSVPTVLTAPGEVITSSSGSKLHSHKVSSSLHPSFIYLYTYLCVYLGGGRHTSSVRWSENSLWGSSLSFHYVNSGAWTQVTCRLDVKHLYPRNHGPPSLRYFETGSLAQAGLELDV